MPDSAPDRSAIEAARATFRARLDAADSDQTLKALHDEFLSRLVDRAKSLKLGDGRKQGTDVGPLINESSVAKVERYVDIGQSRSVSWVVLADPEGNEFCILRGPT